MQAPLENPLWKFSLVIYAEDGVQDECLALQERLGLDVNLLLFCAYAGGMDGVTLSLDDLQEAEAAVTGWQAEVIRPLRQARRALKTWNADAAQALRTQVKKDELMAEQFEQALLWAWSRERFAGRETGPQGAALTANFNHLLRHYGAEGTQADPAAATPNLLRAALRRMPKT